MRSRRCRTRRLNNTDERIKFILNTAVLGLKFNEDEYFRGKVKFDLICKNGAEDDEELGPTTESNKLAALGHKTCTIYQATRT
jgi:hypothetical protein